MNKHLVLANYVQQQPTQTKIWERFKVGSKYLQLYYICHTSKEGCGRK